MPGKLWMWIAWRLPKRLVYYVGVRILAYATDVHGNVEMGAFSAMDALKLWHFNYCNVKGGKAVVDVKDVGQTNLEVVE